MSREIKAPRAWYKPLGVMIQPEHVESINFDTKTIGVYLNMDGRGYHRLRLSDFELMWPTGRKDRNSKAIYDVDVLKVPDLYETPENTVTTYHTETVRWEGGAFLLGDEPMFHDADYISDACEVIGNIHDNPELLQPQGGGKGE
ncbi:YopX family protein [Paenibacillus polymyxa]|uniref:YopX family protein n=1 Tax=Paenibacillus polymyxa TaxID=1406 RepID=UPI0020246EB8|nr:YopX family protein [Paenibacillus polymyxa]WDZ63674.1 YopX family protein [Paenibacillus polymyxa]